MIKLVALAKAISARIVTYLDSLCRRAELGFTFSRPKIRPWGRWDA